MRFVSLAQMPPREQILTSLVNISFAIVSCFSAYKANAVQFVGNSA